MRNINIIEESEKAAIEIENKIKNKTRNLNQKKEDANRAKLRLDGANIQVRKELSNTDAQKELNTILKRQLELKFALRENEKRLEKKFNVLKLKEKLSTAYENINIANDELEESKKEELYKYTSILQTRINL
jgi:hypothetical protein